ncbi:MAG: helix-turn-helix domain-containing protein [Corallococcus sp.]|nr:helix-turn-helix domain-containing protein [Corallococcus sp.]MCM1359375.1 helix-turn-helix domain-containing protein [Corallococcus sp.]MCM1394818.1 helix-turn-helix domain-containing protein [Corallococcus sp.]
MTTLEKIEKLRIERGWSKNYMAMEAMLTQSTVNNLYARKADPKISTLQSLCNAFGITLAQFFAEENDKTADRTRRDKELEEKISKLSDSQKDALLTLLRNIK